jgi:hypothetical protein
MTLGASFSHRHLSFLRINPSKALKAYKSLELKWIRLGCYWDEIEENENNFSFEKLDPLIDYCNKNKIKVLLTVGMKAPRHPEYYFPDWVDSKANFKKLSKIKTNNKKLLESTLNYIEAAIKHYKNNFDVNVWQVENEPLDPSGPNWLRIDYDFLKKEAELVRSLTPEKKVLINIWGNELGKRKLYKKAIRLADIIGLDIYLKHAFSLKGKFIKYIGPIDSKRNIKKIVEEIKKAGKSVWLTELQAEPWEQGEIVTSKIDPPSFPPEQFEKNLEYAGELDPKVTLLWGFEFWYMRKLKGDPRYWNAAKDEIIKHIRD